MKIEDILKFQGQLATEKPKPDPGTGENFAACLKEMQGNMTGQETGSAGGLPPLAQVEMVASVSSSAAGVQALQEGLDRLEQFAQGLDTPGRSLRDLAPLVTAMEADGRKLQDLASSLPGDSPLREMAEEAATLAQVASLKFQRGDFV